MLQTSESYRKNKSSGQKLVRHDYIGAHLNGQNLQGANLRGKLLIAANLKHTNLSFADFIGADLRDANLSAANLTGALFLTQSQINSAKGNHMTVLPDFIERPNHWLT